MSERASGGVSGLEERVASWGTFVVRATEGREQGTTRNKDISLQPHWFIHFRVHIVRFEIHLQVVSPILLMFNFVMSTSKNIQPVTLFTVYVREPRDPDHYALMCENRDTLMSWTRAAAAAAAGCHLVESSSSARLSLSASRTLTSSLRFLSPLPLHLCRARRFARLPRSCPVVSPDPPHHSLGLVSRSALHGTLVFAD